MEDKRENLRWLKCRKIIFIRLESEKVICVFQISIRAPPTRRGFALGVIHNGPLEKVLSLLGKVVGRKNVHEFYIENLREARDSRH